MRVLSVAAVVFAAAGSAQAGSSEIQYAPPPAWIAPTPAPTNTAPPDGAALQILYADSQVRAGPDGTEYYQAYRVKILQPEGLPAGNITAAWNPETDVFTVHAIKIIRAGREIEVLAETKFDVLKRESNLEQAALTGDLTAALQAPGLQVGDELEFVFTLKRRDPTLGERTQGVLSLPAVGLPGAHRVRLVWPRNANLRWQATPDLGTLKPAATGADYVLNYELRDPDTAVTADGAPVRVNLRRFIEFSSFGSWAEAANLLAPFYEKASTLGPDSPVKAEAQKIAAATADPTARAEAALRLVQEQIRYVYVGLDAGNYRPATADETWKRKFGDCKAKTALLLALLRELGVPADAVLVASQGGDGTDERLPSLGAFDHVLVRTKIGGRISWLDGTRLGDRDLDLLPPPPFAWALPVGRGAVKLERVDPQPPLLALSAVLLEVDASRGFDVPATVSAEQILRGDEALAYKTALAQMSAADADRALQGFWSGQYTWITPDKVGWRYDEAQNMVVLTLTGEGEPDWQGDDDRRSLSVWSAGLSPPAKYRRPKEQDQAAPWLTNFPSYKRWTTVLKLPPEADGWKWGWRAGWVDDTLAGTAYWRTSEMTDGVLRTTMSVRTFKPEITAAEAEATNKKLAKFDNKVTQVWQYKPDTAWADEEKQVGQDAKKLLDLGGKLARDGRYDDAMRVYGKIPADDPAAEAVRAGKVVVLERQRDYAAALEMLQPLLKPDTAEDKPDLTLWRARLLAAAGRKPEALAVLETVRAANSRDPEVLANYAGAVQSLGRSDLAKTAVDQGLKFSPDDIGLRQRRLALLAEAQRWGEALQDAEAALRQQPESEANFSNRGTMLARLGRLDEALADFDEALRMNPMSDAALSAKSAALRRAGRKAESAAVYTPAITRNRTADALNNRCWARALGDVELEGAEADCAEAVKLEPKTASYWDSYALVALRRGRMDEALARYEQALALNPALSASLYGRGLAKLRKGDATGGRADIAAAEAAAPRVGERLNEAGLRP